MTHDWRPLREDRYMGKPASRAPWRRYLVEKLFENMDTHPYRSGNPPNCGDALLHEETHALPPR